VRQIKIIRAISLVARIFFASVNALSRIIQFPTTFVQFPRQTESVDTMGGWQAELIKGLSLYIDTAFTMMLV
jgi:hypothetical protein